MNGIFLIDKEVGQSSAKAIARLKRSLGLDRIGHAGTLDPFATGLLVCMVGRATRLAEYAQKGRKVYSGEIQLGIETVTDDITGEILSRSEELPDFSVVEREVKTLCGELQQLPPQVSAIQINGERAYKKARRGELVALKARTVTVYRFEVSPLSYNTISYRIECSTGTYIRALARDLGKALGCGAVVSKLRREHSFPFSVAEARLVDDTSSADLVPWERLFTDIERVALSPQSVERLQHGDLRALIAELPEPPDSGAHRVLCTEQGSERALGLIEWTGEQWRIAANVAVS